MKQIKFVVSGILILAAISLLSFGPRSDAPTPDGFVVVDYWEKWTAAEARQMAMIVDDFNKTVGKEKHIFVRFVSTADIEQKTLVSTAAGVPPDVAGLYDGNLVQFAALDALQPLEQLAAEHHIDEKTYWPVYWKACHYKGHLYAMISTPSAIALHYNKQIMVEAGLDPNVPPRTMDELDADAVVMNRFKDGRLERAGYIPSVPGWYLNQTYMWFGGEIWDAENEKFTLTDPKVVQAFNWIRDYSRRLGAGAIDDFKSGLGGFDSPQNEFMAGTVAFEQQGPWMASYIANRKPEMDGLQPGEVDDPQLPLEQRRARMTWGVAPFPSAEKGKTNVGYCGFDTLVVPRGAKHPQEAFEFIAFVNRQDEMEKLCNMHCKNSPLQAVSANFLQHNKNPYIDVFEDLAKSPNACSLPQVPILAEVQDELQNTIQKIALLHAEPLEALQEAQDRLQKSYNRYAKMQRLRHGG